MTLQRKTPMVRTSFRPPEPKPAKGRRQRKCAVCKEFFEPRSMTHKACKPSCAEELAVKVTALQKAKAQRQERAETKAKLEKFKRLPDYKREAQAAWNSYVRARDAGLPCCSCGATPEQVFGGSMDCSHYRSRGSAPHLSFHLHNAAAACVKCNRFLGGNVVALRAGLIARFGEDKILAVEADNRPRHFTKEYLIRIKKIFTKKARRARK
jgi:hypothetical protein